MALTDEQKNKCIAILTSLKVILDSHPYYTDESVEAFYKYFGNLATDFSGEGGGGDYVTNDQLNTKLADYATTASVSSTYVPTTRTINSKPLNADIVLTQSDIGS